MSKDKKIKNKWILKSLQEYIPEQHKHKKMFFKKIQEQLICKQSKNGIVNKPNKQKITGLNMEILRLLVCTTKFDLEEKQSNSKHRWR